MSGPMGRPALHLPRVVDYLERVDPDHLGLHVADIAPALGATREQISKALTVHIKKAGPKALVTRVKVGVYRLTSPAERGRKVGRARRANTLKRVVAQAVAPDITVGAAALNDMLKASGGWVAPSVEQAMDLPSVTIKRGGIKYLLPLEAGLVIESAVSHVGVEGEIYFVWRSQMWKAQVI